MKHLAAVAVSATNFGFDRRYKYIVPVEMEGKLFVGARVIVPFGKGNRKRVAVVIRIDDAANEDLSGFKPINSVIDSEPLLNEEMLGLMMWIRNTTLCTYFEAFKTLIPIGLSVDITRKYVLSEGEGLSEEILSDKAAELLSDARADISALELAEKKFVDELVSAGFLTEQNSVKRRAKDETVKMFRLTEDFASGELSVNLPPKQKSVAELLKSGGAASQKEICYICGVTSAVIKNMLQKGIVETYEYEVIRAPEVEARENADDIVLTEQQKSVCGGVAELMDKGEPAAALLYGVTGSGKTMVFVKLIQHALDGGKTAIMLIPEISLTPQTVKRFQSLFGDLVAIMHSSLSLTQRLNEYKRVKSGRAKIVVGTRSAIFAPLENIGLIIIDEEGERTYKSEAAPRYNAKEIAKKRCITHNAVVLMASATPSIESFYYAKTGRYKLFTMTNRFSRDKLPDVEIVDLAEEGFYGNSAIFSERLVEEINYNLEKKEQTILLLNRRGYHTYISCADCREPLTCPNCSIPLTYHKVNSRLICHYCGHSEEMTDACPGCGSKRLKLTGIGTQKVEDEVAALFPNARILRMDADTTCSRYVYEKSFKAFENGEYDIMLGTQMIAKGLDFPGVTLVGVVSIDKSLFAGDFRSYERTFSLVTQVVGRCGRGDKQGRAIIQTFVPEHYVLNLAAEQNYSGFYEQEIAARQALLYPPFCDICAVEFSSQIDRCADAASKAFLRLIADSVSTGRIDVPIKVLGPSKCTYEKINGKYRYRIIIKCKNNQKFRDYIEHIYKSAFKLKELANVQMFLDINGDIGL
ncbi:MAG: primosomal protein N' [Ruminococcus sp.]|nr:primosomal protein N' [Ruminococcus sp.]MCM1381646.1 primosomal protein N' [Muribaculaceae bacterium]MCM1478540.1 primosomal protein N' [Muribaculaceae bacterium]